MPVGNGLEEIDGVDKLETVNAALDTLVPLHTNDAEVVDSSEGGIGEREAENEPVTVIEISPVDVLVATKL